MNLFLTYMYII